MSPRVAQRRATAITQTGLLLIWTRHDATRESVTSCKHPLNFEVIISDWKLVLVANGINEENRAVVRSELIDLAAGRRCNRDRCYNFFYSTKNSAKKLAFLLELLLVYAEKDHNIVF
jgi:hypothetical protein